MRETTKGLMNSKNTDRVRLSGGMMAALLITLFYLTPAFSQQGNTAGSAYIGSEACKQCHQDIYDGFKKAPHWQAVMNESLPPDKRGCESCHGPGAKHSESGGKGLIVGFKKTEVKGWSNACLKCHERMTHFSKSGRAADIEGRVACNDCHHIHGASKAGAFLSSSVTRTTTFSVIGLALLILIGKFGGLYRLSRSKDPMVYDHWSWTWVLRSNLRWLVPFGTQAMRDHPFVTIASFCFHLAVFAILMTHIFIWNHPVNAGWWAGSDGIVNVSMFVFIISFLFIVIRRMRAPEVRILTTTADYLLLLLVAAIFVSGYMAYSGVIYRNVLTLHIILGQFFVLLIPFTRFGHMIVFFIVRAIIGVEFGARRGARAW